ncbi:AAA family ATPase [Parahaliea aestuarii]|uniref:AAA domain-containing protein n=1 Tax=Parahaliea aestuarii TaxID=1852021 RepID=A0A5C8ZRE3_9GAMM|nr:AAA family ATPase [Parahaliea aestuarii]TXS91048.1 AAA domain-containing protein [Parahaliea aestuarii]
MQIQGLVDVAVSEVGRVLLGKEAQIRLALCCLFARGHLLIEDLPGMGKTTLSHALADVLGLSYKRVQFTSDLLPADILGVSIYNRNDASFTFHPGPIFTQLLLADEINRTTPRTQSALLEAMAEGQVTVEGETRALPEPFFVIATQNPIHQSGTYPLPESQLDRFLMRLELGYPHPVAEREMFQRKALSGRDSQRPGQCISAAQLQQIREAVAGVHTSDSLLDYLQRLVAYTREAPEFAVGLSPRGALALLDCARTWAVMHNRGHVVPEDLQMVLPAVVAHRLVPSGDFSGDGMALVMQMQRKVDVIRP